MSAETPKDVEALRDGQRCLWNAMSCHSHRLESLEGDLTAAEDGLARTRVDVTLVALACVLSLVLALTALVKASASAVSAARGDAAGEASR